MDASVVATDDRIAGPGKLLLLASVLAAVVLGDIAYRVQIHDLHSPHNWAKATVVVTWAFVGAGAIACWHRPRNRLGPLMVLTGFALLCRQFRYSHDALAFTLFFAISEVSYALVAHTALAYPSGKVRDRPERVFLWLAYSAGLVFPLTILLVYGGGPMRFMGPETRDSLISVASDAVLVDRLQKAFVIVAWGVLAGLFVALVGRRLIQASPRMRRVLAPLVLAAIVSGLRAVFESVRTFTSPPLHFLMNNLFWWQIVGLAALPLAILAGMLLTVVARASLADLLPRLERTPPDKIRDTLAEALDDSTLELRFWLPERRQFVDTSGEAVALPVEGGARAVTLLEQEGEPLAALVHEASLRDEPKLVHAALAAARLALQNARLQAELRAQLTEVQRSRARLIAVADDERRRIERDLHDGAQQRLVALALELRVAQRRLGESASPEIERLLLSAARELQAAVEELRELAHGIHPAILTEEGIAAALASLGSRCPLPVTVEATADRRLSPEAEATAYFVACEALTNAVKHAQASRVRIRAGPADGHYVIAVEDDGVGGADPAGGSGLRGLIDRVEAQGGTLRVESPGGSGTRIVGELPCAS